MSRVKKFVISGGKQEEVRKVLEHKKLSHYFDDIFGSPKSKHEIIQILLEQNKIALPTLFLGDAKLDIEVALDNGFDAVFLSGYSEFKNWKEYLIGKPVQVFDSFEQILNPPN